MFRSGDDEMRAAAQMVGEFLDRSGRDNGVAAGGDHQERLPDLRRIIHRAKLVHRLEGRIRPRHCGRREPQRGIFLEDRRVAGEPHGVRGEGIVDEVGRACQIAPAARHITSAHTQEPHGPQQRARWKRGAAARQVDHRRRQHDAIEPALAGMRDADQHRATHRVCQREVRRRAVRHHHLFDESLNVEFVVGEAPHVTLAPIAQLVLGMALPAPVDGSHREAAVAQIAHGLEILFDLFAASGEYAHRALASGRRRPARKAQADPV